MNNSVLRTVAGSLTSRRGAWVWLAGALAVIILLFGLLSGLSTTERTTATAPPGSESEKVAQELAATSDQDTESLLLVASAKDQGSLNASSLEQFEMLGSELTQELNAETSPSRLSDDKQVAMKTLTWAKSSGDAAKHTVTHVRETILEHKFESLQVQVTGAPAFAADISQAFAGANFTLLAVTVGIVAILLIATYRSPILWLIPLAVVALADRSASLLATALGNTFSLHFDSGILSVLVFGAGTNYALLLISRYRDELRKNPDHRTSLKTAWVQSFEAIITSNLTVVLALLTLGLALMDDTRGLGLVCAVGLLLAAVFVLLLLPPILSLSGRAVFWPLVPRAGQASPKPNLWARLSASVIRRPALNSMALILILLVLSSASIGTKIGLQPSEQFRTTTESASAMQGLSEHFPPGESEPIVVLSTPGTGEELREKFTGLENVQRIGEPVTLSGGGWDQITVIASDTPGSDTSRELIQELRAVASSTPDATVLIGGQAAEQLDSHQGHLRDFWVITPLIALICLAMLRWLTRSWRTAITLTVVNLFSAGAAIGLGSLISRSLFDTPALDVQVPLLAFVFLVALGVDYTIFLTQRIKQNALKMTLNDALVASSGQTGSVITSAGIVLAGVFAALATLPLTVLGQLGLIVGLGIVLDTFIVRTLLLPAILAVLGRKRTSIFGQSQPSTSANQTNPTYEESTTHA